MIALLQQIGGLVFLFVAIWVGWLRWVKPYRGDLGTQGQGLLMLGVATVAGGAIGSPFWWMDYPNSFSWALPPLAARLLAAAGIAFAVTGCYALEYRSEPLIRSYVAMLAVYLAPLVAAILVFHLDRFDWEAPITYAFFAIAGGMAAAAIWHLVRGTTLGKKFQDFDPLPASALVRAWFWLVAVVIGLWGLALFVHPQGAVSEIGVWPQDALTSRLIASMLLTLGTGALLGLRSALSARMSLWMFVVYGAGAPAACFWNLASAKPVLVSYASAFCLLGSISLILLMIDATASAATRAR